MTNDERDEMLRETHDAALTTQTRCESCRKKVCELARTVKGSNNTPGLTTRVGKLEMAVLGFATSIGLVLLVAIVGWAFGRL